jgi:hypothetical protein
MCICWHNSNEKKIAKGSNTEEKADIMNRPGKGERTSDSGRSVRLAVSIVCTIGAKAKYSLTKNLK